ncbi:MAG: DUF3810 domain-containing protein [bacterium]
MESPAKIRAGFIGIALTFFLLMQLLAQYPTFVERYYSNGLYPVLTLFISGVTNQFPFSISEVVLWFALLVVLPVLARRLFKRKMSIVRFFLNLATTISIVVVWFYVCWGINYLRVPLITTLKLDRVALEIDAFDSTCVEIIQNANELNLSYSIKDLAEINEIVESSYVEVLEELGLKKMPGPKVLKEFAGNWLLNITTTSGWFSPFFHEVHFNNDLLIIEIPFVIAHEKAHQMGYTNEAECNFLAYLVCLNASDPLVQYSGYFNVLGYFLQHLKENQEKREQFVQSIKEGVKLDLAAVRERWKSHRGWVSSLSDKSYDLYLKANQVKEGRQNYARVVDLIVKYNEKISQMEG